MASTTLLHFNYSLNMMMTKFTLVIATLILILIAQNCFKGFASLKARIVLEKQLFARQLLVMIVKWLLLLTLAQDRKRLL